MFIDRHIMSQIYDQFMEDVVLSKRERVPRKIGCE